VAQVLCAGRPTGCVGGVDQRDKMCCKLWCRVWVVLAEASVSLLLYTKQPANLT